MCTFWLLAVTNWSSRKNIQQMDRKQRRWRHHRSFWNGCHGNTHLHIASFTHTQLALSLQCSDTITFEVYSSPAGEQDRQSLNQDRLDGAKLSKTHTEKWTKKTRERKPTSVSRFSRQFCSCVDHQGSAAASLLEAASVKKKRHQLMLNE